MYPMKLKPIYNKTIWADDRLTTLRGEEERGCGTSWEISAHPFSKNVITNGELAGKTLDEVLDSDEKAMLGEHSREQMLRLAFLDAKDDLSIQVHPYEEYAKKYENDLGKTEAWYVLEAEEGATLVAGTVCDDEEEIRTAIKEERLEPLLRKVPMQKGDFIFVPAGMLHALGGGILAIEVGTNSNVTYRFYDYGRKDANGNGRELHLDKSFDVADFKLRTEKVSTPFVESDHTTSKVLVDCDEFTVELYDVKGECSFDTNGKDFHCVTFVSGDGVICCGDTEAEMKYTESAFIPANCGAYTVKGNVRILKSYVK